MRNSENHITFFTKLIPTKNDCLLYVLTRTQDGAARLNPKADLIEDGFKGKRKANRGKENELKLLQKEFHEKQTDQIKLGVE